MTKEKPKSWLNVPFKTWRYEGQTENKHNVLKYYMGLWFQVLSKYNTNLNYIDGFGGIGAYHLKKDISQNEYVSEKYGSPVISAMIIDELKKEKKIENANILIIEKEEENIKNIQTILNYKNIDISRIQFIEGDFDIEINNFLDKFDNNLAPTFFMIDPFGFAQIKLSTIKRIMSFNKAEVFLNFMYNAIQRWTTHPNLEKCYNDLFGCNDWKKYTDKRTDEKEFNLVNLFRNQCKKFSKFVYPFRLQFPDKNMPYYYLFHLSNHYKGCSLMKDSFTACNDGSIEYVGNTLPSLFDSLPSHKNLDRCKSCYTKEQNEECSICMLKKFFEKSISYKEFMENIIDELPFKEGDIRKILQEMEKNKIIEIESDRKRRGGFKDNDKIIFNPKTL